MSISGRGQAHLKTHRGQIPSMPLAENHTVPGDINSPLHTLPAQQRYCFPGLYCVTPDMDRNSCLWDDSIRLLLQVSCKAVTLHLQCQHKYIQLPQPMYSRHRNSCWRTRFCISSSAQLYFASTLFSPRKLITFHSVPVLPTKAGKTILVPATNSGRRKLACPPVLHVLLTRADPQSAAEALALTTALADFTNTRNTKDMNIETLSVRLRDPSHTASSSAGSGSFGQRWRT